MTRKQRRLTLVATGLGVLALAAALVLSALKDSIVFFNSPTDVIEKGAPIFRLDSTKQEADLEVAALGPDRTQLSISGRYRTPLGLLGRAMDRALLHRVAEATVKDFLDRAGEALRGIHARGSVDLSAATS